MTRLALLLAAGSIGTLARYLLSGWAQRLYGGELPVGTLAVNLVGCLGFGLIWAMAEDRMVISGETRFIILTGFMGAFTTFSSFAFETSALLRDAQWLWAVANIVAQNVLGIGAVILGMALGRLF